MPFWNPFSSSKGDKDKDSKPNPGPSHKVLCYSKKPELTEITWHILDFGHLTANPGERENIDFEAGRSIGAHSKWSFTTFVEPNGFLSIYLNLDDDLGCCPENLFACFSVAIPSPTPGGADLAANETSIQDMKVLRRFGFSHLVDIARLNVAFPTNNPSNATTLPIKLAFKLYGKESNFVMEDCTPSTNNSEEFKTEALTAFSENMKAVYQTPDLLSDFTITVENGDGVAPTSFKTHKVVLAARSLMFNAMFQPNPPEAAPDSLALKDVPSEAVDICLKFMYSGVLEEDWATFAVHVIEWADKFQVPKMKDSCDVTLYLHTTNANAWEFLAICKKYNLRRSVDQITSFILGNLSRPVP